MIISKQNKFHLSYYNSDGINKVKGTIAMTCIELPAPAESCLLSMVNRGCYGDYRLYKNPRLTGRSLIDTIVCPVPDIIYELNCFKALWMKDGDNARYDSLKESYILGVIKINEMITPKYLVDFI